MAARTGDNQPPVRPDFMQPLEAAIEAEVRGVPPEPFAFQPSNAQFLAAIFKTFWHHVHVTGFNDDPSNIAPDRRGICWGGKDMQRANGELAVGNNQYFCISGFWPDENGRPVRRKANFRAMFCVVADDVKDKIPEAQAKLLPPPSWRLETSPGNEQWGWILSEPEVSLRRAENLLDGLVKLGLSPDGTDPGMRGVTRYVRLPEGWNTKRKYGESFKCRMLEWAPTRSVTMEQLAAPFGVDLNARRSDCGASGEAAVLPEDAPIMQWLNDGNLITEKGEGEYLIRCPWVHEHSDGDDSGTWIKTVDDGSLQFQCQHGHCQDRTTVDFLKETGLLGQHDSWRAFRNIPLPKEVSDAPRNRNHLTLVSSRGQPECSDLHADSAGAGGGQPQLPTPGSLSDEVPPVPGTHPAHADDSSPSDHPGGGVGGDRGVGLQHGGADAGGDQPVDGLSDEAAELAPDTAIGTQHIEAIPASPEPINVEQVRGIAGAIAQIADVATRDAVTRQLLARVGRRLAADVVRGMVATARSQQVQRDLPVGQQLLDRLVFIRSAGKYYDTGSDVLMSAETVDRWLAQYAFWGEPGEEGLPVQIKPTEAFDRNEEKREADGLSWYPRPDAPYQYWERQKLCNTYHPPTMVPAAGDVSMWLQLMHGIYGQYADYVIDHMAFTLQKPWIKITWQIFCYGLERTGKTSGTKPLAMILQSMAANIRNEDISGQTSWGDHFARKKVLIIEELYQAGRHDFYNNMKTRFSNDGIETLNIKGKGMIEQRNRYSMYMYSNHEDALTFNESDGKLLIVEVTHHIPGLEDDKVRAEWFRAYHNWLEDGGAQAVYHYLLNRDVSNFSHNVLPVKTEAYMKAQRAGMPEYQQFVAQLIEDEEGPFASEAVSLDGPFGVVAYLKEHGHVRGTRKGVVNVMKKHAYENYVGVARVGGKVTKVRFFSKNPELKDMRATDLFDFYTNSLRPELHVVE